MRKAKMLPSGAYRVQVQKDGIRKSFTAKTQQEAELMAAEFAAGRNQAPKSSLSLSKAIQAYIDASDGTLSPSTIRGYSAWLRQIEKDDIHARKISDITTADLQLFVKRLLKDYSAKSIRNIYGLVSASMGFHGVPMPRGVNLPTVERKVYSVPNTDDLKRVLKDVKGTKMEIPVLLGICGLRLSEIVGLTTQDLDKDQHAVYIHRAVVMDQNNALVTKGTKTRSSTRTIILPPFIFDKLAALDDGPITPLTPHAITDRWFHIRKRAGIDTRFHDLRHFSVSIAHALGVGDQYIMHRHGFATDSTMKRVYRNEIDTYEKQANDVINDFYEKNFK